MSENGILKVGIDLGTNTTVIGTPSDGNGSFQQSQLVTTVVGYPKRNVLPEILPGEGGPLVGEEAIRNRLYVDLKWPLERGEIADVGAAQDFLGHIHGLLGSNGQHQLWVVVGAPAGAQDRALRILRRAMGKRFARFLIMPEPFLAALGMRQELSHHSHRSLQSLKNSLIIDIGAGTIDLCMVQGCYPGPEDQVCIPRAGNDIDLELRLGIRSKYPDVRLRGVSVTRIKERHSFVGKPPGKVVARVPAEGRPVKIEITDLMRDACESIVPDVLEGIEELARRCDPDVVESMLGNIILTGGGSQIRGMATHLKSRLEDRGFVGVQLQIPRDYKKLVARGALKMASDAREDQWQHPVV